MTGYTRLGWAAAGMIAAAVLLPSVARADPNVVTKGNIAWQIALDRVGFSAGVIDGKAGPKTLLATREYQRANRLPVTGGADTATAAALQIDPAKALTTYTVVAGDSDDIGPAPKTWPEKAKLPRLAYENLAALVGEKFHCSQNCLAELNPGKALAQLKAGDVLTVPNIAKDAPTSKGSKIEISFSEKTVRVIDDANHLVGLFCCSIAKDKENLPTVRQTSVVTITHNPQYKFDPKMWPEVKDVHEVLIIQAGPRNPVGLCWMGLALGGYGMHGTPMPDLIGKTGSHGCFRLTNWDAVRLSKMIQVGTPVTFVTGAGGATVAAGGPAAAGGASTPSGRTPVEAPSSAGPPAATVHRAVAPAGFD
jgi:lipoprotein-anchoring transpeptidase ErfK/SrfK